MIFSPVNLKTFLDIGDHTLKKPLDKYLQIERNRMVMIYKRLKGKLYGRGSKLDYFQFSNLLTLENNIFHSMSSFRS